MNAEVIELYPQPPDLTTKRPLFCWPCAVAVGGTVGFWGVVVYAIWRAFNG